MKKLLLLPLFLITCFCLAQDAKEIIGKPIKIGNLLVAQYDFPLPMNWDDAKKACETLGDGWRLPTKNELNTLYIERNKIGGFPNLVCWSSTGYDSIYAWGQYLTDGKKYVDYKISKHYVRAVKSL